MALPLHRPAGWEKPRLTEYLESMWGNCLATFANKEEAHRLCLIDDLIFDAAKGFQGGPPTGETVVPLFMFYRAHSAFGAACGLGMGGATVEGMAVLRLA